MPLSGGLREVAGWHGARPRGYRGVVAGTWSSLGKQLGRMALREAPRVAPRIPQLLSQAKQQIRRARSDDAPAPEITPGRPVASTTFPTAQRARRVAYAPDLDGLADPGEIVWSWVTFEEDPGQGKDRPVLVVGRSGATLLGLMLSSQTRHEGQTDWFALGTGSWDREGRASWVRLDRVLDVPEEGIRREGAILDRTRFDAIAQRLRDGYGWS